MVIAFKAPVVIALAVLWWLGRQKPDEPSSSDDDGGIKFKPHHRPHPPFPHRPRRGPHGDPAPAPPSRVRTVRARARARAVDH